MGDPDLTPLRALALADEAPYGEGSHAPLDDPDQAPSGFEIKGNYLAADPIGDNNTFKQYNLGVGYPFGASKVYANVQQNKIGSSAKGNAWALAYSYSLSKRTNLYASYANLNNNGLATFGLNSGSNTLAPAATSLGADPSVFTVGLRHTF